MAASEELRHEVRGYFTDMMDKERAAKVMEVIPSVDGADLATKQDLLVTEQRLRQEIAAVRVELYQALGEMRGEMHKSLADVHKSLADVHKALTWHTLSIIGATGTTVGLAFGLAHWL